MAGTEAEENIDLTFRDFVASLKQDLKLKGTSDEHAAHAMAETAEGNFKDALKASGLEDKPGLPLATQIITQIEDMVKAGTDPKTSDIAVGHSHHLSDFGVHGGHDAPAHEAAPPAPAAPAPEAPHASAHAAPAAASRMTDAELSAKLTILGFDGDPKEQIREFRRGFNSPGIASVSDMNSPAMAAKIDNIINVQTHILEQAIPDLKTLGKLNPNLPEDKDNAGGHMGVAISPAFREITAITKDPAFRAEPGIDANITAMNIIHTQRELADLGMGEVSVAQAANPVVMDEAKAFNKLGVGGASMEEAEAAFRTKYHIADASVPILSADGKSGPLVNVLQKEVLAAEGKITAPADGFDAHKLPDIDTKFPGTPSDLKGLATALEKGHADMGAATANLDKAVKTGAETGVLHVTDGIVSTDDLAKVSKDPKKPVSLEDVETAELQAMRIALGKELGITLPTDSPTATAADTAAITAFKKEQHMEGASTGEALAKFGDEIAQLAKIILDHGGDLKAVASDPAATHVAVPPGLKGHDDTPAH